MKYIVAILAQITVGLLLFHFNVDRYWVGLNSAIAYFFIRDIYDSLVYLIKR